MATWFVRLDNGSETHDLPQPDRVTAKETARLCRLAAPSVRVTVIDTEEWQPDPTPRCSVLDLTPDGPEPCGGPASVACAVCGRLLCEYHGECPCTED